MNINIFEKDGHKIIDMPFILNVNKAYEITDQDIEEMDMDFGLIQDLGGFLKSKNRAEDHKKPKNREKENKEDEDEEESPFTLKSGDWVVEGFAATSDLDRQNDIIAPKALREAVDQILADARTVLRNHDLDDEIGVITSAKFVPKSKGLWVQLKISKTREDIWTKVQEGVLNKFSIRAQIVDHEERFDEESQRNILFIKAIKMIEVSLVSVPANPNASVLDHFVQKAFDKYFSFEGVLKLDKRTPNKNQDVDNKNEGESAMAKKKANKSGSEEVTKTVKTVEIKENESTAEETSTKETQKSEGNKNSKEETSVNKSENAEQEANASKEGNEEVVEKSVEETTEKSEESTTEKSEENSTEESAKETDSAETEKSEETTSEETEKSVEENSVKEEETSKENSAEETQEEVSNENSEEEAQTSKEDTLKGIESLLSTVENEELKKSLEVSAETIRDLIKQEQDALENEKNKHVTVEMHENLCKRIDEMALVVTKTIETNNELLKSITGKFDSVIESVSKLVGEINKSCDENNEFRKETLGGIKELEKVISSEKSLDGQETEADEKVSKWGGVLKINKH